MKRYLLLFPLLLFVACSRSAPQLSVPLEITGTTVCSLDGMRLADYPGPKAQIHYQQGPPEFFCDTLEMFAVFLQPEQHQRVIALYVQDMTAADWRQPAGRWIEARDAVFVSGSNQRGSMGATLVPFAREDAALAFIAAHGGRLLRFGEITPELVDLDGGALHDEAM